MAITRSQQAKQMLQDGGMLVQPGFGGMRQGYRGDDAYGGGGDKGGNTGGGNGDARSDRMGDKGKKGPPGGLSNEARADLEAMTKGLRSSISAQNRAAAVRDAINKAKNFLPGGKFSLTGVLGNILGGPTTKGNLGIEGYNMANIAGPSQTDDDDDEGGEGENYMAPTFAQTQITPGLPAAVMPMQNPMDLNRIAYRFFADGGFLDDEDEPRQAYGLGSIVKKAFKTVRKPFKAVTKTLKKVAKSPTGRLLLAVAAPYALGPAVASSAALGGLSAAQQAALISAATTGITQVASGEDLDFKDIALSAALSGAAAKALPPGGSQATGASKAASASKFQMPRGGGADFSQIAASSTRPNMFDIAGPVKGGSGISNIIKNVTPEKSSLFSTLGKSLKNIGTKGLDFAKENPLLTIAGASGLAGLMAKREEQEEPGEVDRGPGIDIAAIRRRPFDYMAPRFAGSQFDFYAAEGGQAKKEPVAKKVMPLLDMGGMEKDYRAEGGFVPIGRMEKADDVPARLSKNEFVFTADAVRNAGDGDVDKGAEVMYNMMKNLEAGGDVSEESQGLEGARRMFQTSQRLEEVL